MSKWIFLAMIIISVSARAEGAFTHKQICSAGIAASVGILPNNIKTEDAPAKRGVYVLSYMRNDGRNYAYLCKLESDEIRWRRVGGMATWNNNLRFFYSLSSGGKRLDISGKDRGSSMGRVASYYQSDFLKKSNE